MTGGLRTPPGSCAYDNIRQHSPPTDAGILSLSHTLSHFQASVACGVLIKIIKMIKRLDRIKNTVNTYRADIRPDRLTTCQSEQKSVVSRRPTVHI
jgi:hypothetical protein